MFLDTSSELWLPFFGENESMNMGYHSNVGHVFVRVYLIFWLYLGCHDPNNKRIFIWLAVKSRFFCLPKRLFLGILANLSKVYFKSLSITPVM